MRKNVQSASISHIARLWGACTRTTVWRALCQGVAVTDPKRQSSAVLGGDPVGQVGALKEQPGYDIMVAASPCATV
jgi:hypothetical protein